MSKQMSRTLLILSMLPLIGPFLLVYVLMKSIQKIILYKLKLLGNYLRILDELENYGIPLPEEYFHRKEVESEFNRMTRAPLRISIIYGLLATLSDITRIYAYTTLLDDYSYLFKRKIKVKSIIAPLTLALLTQGLFVGMLFKLNMKPLVLLTPSSSLINISWVTSSITILLNNPLAKTISILGLLISTPLIAITHAKILSYKIHFKIGKAEEKAIKLTPKLRKTIMRIRELEAPPPYSEHIICENCKKAVPSIAFYCPYCGSRLKRQNDHTLFNVDL